MTCRFFIYKKFCLKNKEIDVKEDFLIIKLIKCVHIEKQSTCRYFSTGKPSRYISKGNRYEVLKRQNWKCNICDKHLKYSENHKFGDEVAHIDHIHPFSDWESYGGDINELSNLQALCPDCNMKKHKNKIN